MRGRKIHSRNLFGPNCQEWQGNEFLTLSNGKQWSEQLVFAKRNTTYFFWRKIHFASRFRCVLDPSFNERGEYEVLLHVS